MARVGRVDPHVRDGEVVTGLPPTRRNAPQLHGGPLAAVEVDLVGD
jgi:hypothetical protein